MKKTHIWRKVRAAAALMAAGLIALASASSASADITGGGSTTVNVHAIDGSRNGSLTIHKYEAPETPTGLPANGTEQDLTLTPMAGVGFVVYKVDQIDLTKNAGWKKAAELSYAFDGTTDSITGLGYTVTAVGSERFTDSVGEIGYTDLPLGLYYVVETSPKPGSTAVASFLVTVPLTDPVDTDTWLYDVHVYPKNAVTSLGKTVDDDTAIKLGDKIVYTIKADIPNVDSIDKYKIVDDLDSKLDFVSATVSLTDGTALVEGVDYSLTPAVATAGGPTVVVEFSQAGRDKLVAHKGAQVQMVIVTTVNTIGEITNEALLYPNGESYEIEPGKPGGPTETPGVETKWGEITLQKLDVDGTTKLSGAVFSVYLTEADAKARTNPVILAGVAEFTVDATGELTISGLRYSDWADGAAVAPGDAGYQYYWLVEKTAPIGYELLAEPIRFIIDAESSTVGVDLEVLNVPSNGGFDLPRTGGTGSLAFWLGGGLLVGGGLLLALYLRRRNQATA